MFSLSAVLCCVIAVTALIALFLDLRNWPHVAGQCNAAELGKSSESVQCAMLNACDACAEMRQL